MRFAHAYSHRSVCATGTILAIMSVFAMAELTAPAMAGNTREVVYEAEGLQATAHTDCDSSAYTVVALGDGHDARRYAAYGSFATLIEPHLEAILTRSAAWLDRPGGCEAGPNAQTITVVGVVSALPIFATAAERDKGWRPGSAMSTSGYTTTARKSRT